MEVKLILRHWGGRRMTFRKITFGEKPLHLVINNGILCGSTHLARGRKEGDFLSVWYNILFNKCSC